MKRSLKSGQAVKRKESGGGPGDPVAFVKERCESTPCYRSCRVSCGVSGTKRCEALAHGPRRAGGARPPAALRGGLAAGIPRVRNQESSVCRGAFSISPSRSRSPSIENLSLPLAVRLSLWAPSRPLSVPLSLHGPACRETSLGRHVPGHVLPTARQPYKTKGARSNVNLPSLQPVVRNLTDRTCP